MSNLIMVSKSEFCEQVNHAYQYLYDFVRLRSHPLARLLITDPAIDHKERGWQVHHILLAVIEELYPGASAPPYSKEWRRHRLMMLRYVEGIPPQAVADQLAISRRQYYREHASAIQAVADLLWPRCNQELLTDEIDAPTASASVEAMQQELARISQDDVYANLSEVIEGVVVVLGKVLEQNCIVLEIALPTETPIVSISHNLLRQVLLGALGYLVDHLPGSKIRITVQIADTALSLRMVAEAPDLASAAEIENHLADLREMLQMVNAQIGLLGSQSSAVGFCLELPVEYLWTVLVVDDNEDTLALFKRYLTPNRYRVITTSSARLVAELTRKIQPDAVILDLMMPDLDGWDVLQALSNQPDTAHIPIMICSVLKQRDLALSLGASAYLPKPFTEQSLLMMLNTLHGSG